MSGSDMVFDYVQLTINITTTVPHLVNLTMKYISLKPPLVLIGPWSSHNTKAFHLTSKVPMKRQENQQTIFLKMHKTEQRVLKRQVTGSHAACSQRAGN